MADAVTPWLPGAAVDAGIDRALTGAARDWSLRWLPAGVLLPVDGPEPEVERWLVSGDDMALGLPATARIGLGKTLLAAPSGAGVASATDRRMVDAVAQAAWHDLGSRVAATLHSDRSPVETSTRPPVWSGTRRRLFVIDADVLFVCRIAGSAAVDLVRKRSPVTPRPPLAGLAEALSSQRVTVGARVGGCTLTLADLATLEPGDVVPLDRLVGDAVDLTVDAGSQSLARCTLLPGDDRLSLQLLEPIDR